MGLVNQKTPLSEIRPLHSLRQADLHKPVNCPSVDTYLKSDFLSPTMWTGNSWLGTICPGAEDSVPRSEPGPYAQHIHPEAENASLYRDKNGTNVLWDRNEKQWGLDCLNWIGYIVGTDLWEYSTPFQHLTLFYPFTWTDFYYYWQVLNCFQKVVRRTLNRGLFKNVWKL